MWDWHYYYHIVFAEDTLHLGRRYTHSLNTLVDAVSTMQATGLSVHGLSFKIVAAVLTFLSRGHDSVLRV
jgi:hypothetical protein